MLLQLNATNLFDEQYLGNISSQTNALTITDVDPVTAGNQSRSGSAPTYSVGAPQTFQVQLKTKF
jgi:iron complex outermembrane receptor protein